MRINGKNLHIIVIFCLIVCSGMVIPVISVGLFRPSIQKSAPKGQPVSESRFQVLVSQTPDPVMFPQYPIIETETSITMNSDFSSCDVVNMTTASSTALNFISQIGYLSEYNFSEVTGWTNLHDGVWHFKHICTNFSVYTSVNALSGKVNGFAAVWNGGDSPYKPAENESSFAAPTLVENLALEFLKHFNYTLSASAQYVGPTLKYNYVFHHNVSHISFYHVVNGSLIESSAVHLYIDVMARAVIAFSYWWVDLNILPVGHIIALERVQEIAIDYLSQSMNQSEYNICSAALIFDRTGAPLGKIYRLSWEVFVESERISAIYIDAKSGDIYDLKERMISSDLEFDVTISTIQRPSMHLIVLVLLGSFSIAAFSMLLAKRRILTTYQK